MNILITAGSTRTMIDKVRCITNIFKGKTGHNIAKYFSAGRGHDVKLITSGDFLASITTKNPEVVKYRTYDELYENMECVISSGWPDVIIHSAAVSDYKPDGVFINVPSTDYGNAKFLKELDSSGKVGSDHNELYIKMIPTEKIIDRIRDSWGFTGKLVKFKLQVEMTDDKLINVAIESMIHSDADMIIANSLEWIDKNAYVITKDINPVLVPREQISEYINDLIKGSYNE